jgi:formylglycine-generating enzyme required for sulfatase activity
MKYPYLLLLVLLNSSFISAKKNVVSVINCKPIHSDFLFAAQTELTNIQYLEFLNFQKTRVADKVYESLLPDTLCWNKKNSYMEPMVEYYFRHPAYRSYPVVGLNKMQMKAYCNWLSGILTQKYRGDDKSIIDSVLVRLPTTKEWQKAARGGLSQFNEYPWDGFSLRMEDKKWAGDMRANFVRGKGDYMGVAGHLNDNADVTAPAFSYWPNGFDLYNFAGNVSEAVSDQDAAYGGSWRSYGSEIKVTASVPFDKPSSQVGMRYFVEVKKYKTPKKSKELKLNKKYFKSHISDITDSTQMMSFEVDNELYNLFLKETNHSVQDTSVWTGAFQYSDRYMINYRWYEGYKNHPAVGFTKADIQAFAVWYQQKYEEVIGIKVTARLPSEKEWEYAASGGLEMSPYPWGGPYIRNAKGGFLANFKYVPEKFYTGKQGNYNTDIPEGEDQLLGADFDGLLITGPVDSYHPNGFGLYNMAGNVSEWVQENDRLKGGSWYSQSYFLQITSQEEKNKIAKCEAGFRLILVN